MDFISGILGNLISDLISSPTKFLVQNLTDNVTWKKWKAEQRLSKNESDFLDRYAEALVALKRSRKPKELLRFYGEQSVIHLIQEHWYGIIDEVSFDKSLSALTHTFTLEKQLEDFSAKEEIAFFLINFRQAVHQNRTAGEAEDSKKLDKILEEVQQGQEVLPPKYLTHILSIDLEKEFIGREVDMQRLKDKLENASNVVLINGLGGIGKTVLATAYVQKYGSNYDHVAWINQGEDFIDSIALNEYLADTLRLPFKKEEELGGRFRRILRKLHQLPGQNLLVIDNAQEQVAQKEIYYHFSGSFNWHVLLTSRLDMEGFDSMGLGTLNPDVAKALFRTHFDGPHTEAELEELLEGIGYHTLTIELLARLLNKLNNILSISELTAILRQKRLNEPDLQEKIWTRHSGEERGIFLHLMKVFELSQLEEKEKWLLKQFAILPAEQYLVVTLADFLQEKPLGLNKVLNSLAAKGWLILHENKTFSIHRLIQQVAEYQLQPVFADGGTLVESMIQKMSVDAYTSRIAATAPWVKYATAVADFFTEEKCEQIATLLNEIAGTYDDLGQYTEALSYHKKALVIQEEVLDSNHPDLASSYHNISLTYLDLGEYNEALTYGKKASIIRERVLGPNHPDLAAPYNVIATVYREIGRYAKALSYHKKAVDLQEEVLDSNHPNLASSYNNMAGTYRALRRFSDALCYQQKALLIREEALNPKDPFIAQSFNDIGLTYRDLEQYADALQFLKKALFIQEEVYGLNHPYLAVSYNNIGLCFFDLRQYTEALIYHKKALVIFEEELDFYHPDRATSYHNIAEAYRALEQFVEALDYHQRALTIRKEVLDASHPELATSYNKIALTYGALGQQDKAEEYEAKAAGIRTKGNE